MQIHENQGNLLALLPVDLNCFLAIGSQDGADADLLQQGLGQKLVGSVIFDYQHGVFLIQRRQFSASCLNLPCCSYSLEAEEIKQGIEKYGGDNWLADSDINFVFVQPVEEIFPHQRQEHDELRRL